MAFPVPCQLLPQLWDKGRDALSLVFPRLFAELEKVEEEVEGAEAVKVPPLSSVGLPRPDTAILPGCCQSSYRALFASLLLPFLPLTTSPFLSTSTPAVSPSASAVDAGSVRGVDAVDSFPSSCSSSLLPSIHPEAHAEVLFDCPDDSDGAGQWAEKHRSDEEDDSQVYFRPPLRPLPLHGGRSPSILIHHTRSALPHGFPLTSMAHTSLTHSCQLPRLMCAPFLRSVLVRRGSQGGR